MRLNISCSNSSPVRNRNSPGPYDFDSFAVRNFNVTHGDRNAGSSIIAYLGLLNLTFTDLKSTDVNIHANKPNPAHERGRRENEKGGEEI